MDLSTPEVAERLGISRVTVWRWYKKDYFPNAYPVDPNNPHSDIRIPEQDVIAIEEKREQIRKKRQITTPQQNTD